MSVELIKVLLAKLSKSSTLPNTMSHNNPIPIRHRDEFNAHMLRFDRPGASPAMRALELQDASNEFCDMHDKLRFADPVKAVGQYLRMVDQ